MMGCRRWALITGAGNLTADKADGIGAALAMRLLQAGISVVAVGRRQSALDRNKARQEAIGLSTL
jgi:NAD(P)-dependent dehydrogenase (short-subunit alcohol dehydrogenase family)